MQKRLATAATLAFAFISSTAHAGAWDELVDRAQVGAGLGYMFGFDVGTTAGEVGFNGGLSYQLEADLRIPSETLLLLNYTWLPTELELERTNGTTGDLGDLNLHFFQFGAAREFLYGQWRPFAFLTFGATLFSSSFYDDEWKISSTLGAGLKYLPSPKFGMRAQVRLMNSFATNNSNIFCSFSGCDYGLTGGGILHTDLAGVLFWVF